MKQFLLIAVRSLLQHKRRNLFLGAAIAAVTALLVMLLGLSTGIQSTMLRSATTLSSGHINVAGFFKVTSSNPAPVVTDYQKLRDLVVRETPGLDYVIDRGRGWAKVISETGSFQSGINGVNIEQEQGLRDVLQLAAQREYKEGGGDEVKGDIARLAEPDSILIFVDQAKRLGVDVGDQVTLSAPTWRGVNNTVDVTVVAIARNVGFMSAWSVFTPQQVVRDIYRLTADTTGAIMVYLKDPEKIPEAEEHLRRVIADAGYVMMEKLGQPFFMKFDIVRREDWTGQKIDITNWRDEISFMSWTIDALDTLTVLLVGILMVLIMVGIMNTLWIAIRERTREIGTLRAIGMQKGKVLWMFLLEAMLLGLFATSAGAAIGGLTAWIINVTGVSVPIEAFQIFTMSETLWLEVKAGAVARAILVITLLTTLSALYPAYRAMKLRPISAIHHIG
jgi:ABC-type lipoprotein release transport system permease subunit